MNLLDKHNATVDIFPEESFIDPDGNTVRRASSTAVSDVPAWIWPIASVEPDDPRGPVTIETYGLRFPRWVQLQELGPASRVRWNGEVWSVEGAPKKHRSSKNSTRNEYRIVK